MPLVYEDSFRVYQFECDPWDRMTPGAMLRRIQEIGTQQCGMLGLDDVHYKATHTVFLLSRISLEIYKVPVFGQQVRIETRAYGVYRAVYQRVTTLYDAATGEKLCEADSRWVLVDTSTRRILRREPEGFNSPFKPVQSLGEQGHSMETPAKPTTLELYGRRTASYMLCDRNGHLNNTHYADLLCDCLPLALMEQKPIRKILLFYKAEIKMGNEFTLSGGMAGEGQETHYFLAEEESHKNFEAYVTF